jgi:two-component system phosphate regulon response regulator PhoB
MSRDTVLVVEDDRDLARVLRYNLEKEGYEALLADTGEKGYDLARTRRPSLVILDLMLPEMNGLEVCRLLKYDSATKGIPVLILTAKSSETDEVVGFELGAADYVTKPFSVKILLARIKNVLKASKPARPDAPLVRCGPFLLDRERFLFTLDGKPAALTRIEFRVLAALAERSGFVLTRQEIARAAWGEGALVSAATINMHVKTIRAKLGRHRGALETVRGAGYRLREAA